jgi:predicted ATPase
LAWAHAELNQFEEARCCVEEAMTVMDVTNERWCEAEIHRTSGEIGLKSPEHDAVKAEAHFECALAIARAQQAKSWELVYGWFAEGSDTLDLREARRCWMNLAA